VIAIICIRKVEKRVRKSYEFIKLQIVVLDRQLQSYSELTVAYRECTL
jgi:hypothetical protein